jgi:hypothetical protein
VSSWRGNGELGSILTWPVHRWLVAAGVAAATAVATAVPTGVIATDFFTRMTPVRWWDYPLWIAASVLVGLTAATYMRIADATSEQGARPGTTIGGSLLTVFAIGCPVCNKLVVAILGFGGALTYFAPLQPVLGLTSIALLTWGLRVRLRGDVRCAPAPALLPPR